MALADIIKPEPFNAYMREDKYVSNFLLDSGIATRDANIVINRGGREVHLPFWKRNYASDEVMSETQGATLNEIKAGEDVACIHARVVGYKSNDLERILSGDKPAEALADYLADEWNNNLQIILAKTLEGAFASDSMSDATITATELTGSAMIDAQYLLGDAFNKLSGVIVHSAVMAALKKRDLIQFEKESDANKLVPYYMGQKVFVDDVLTPIDGSYPIYFFGNGAIAFNENMEEANTEIGRDIVAGNDEIVSRRVFTMHPRGVKWIGEAAGVTPTNAELATGTNWELVANRKNVAISRLLVSLDSSSSGSGGNTGDENP